MALVTPHIQGSYSTFLSRPLAWNKGLKLKPHRVTFPVKKCSFCLSVGSPHAHGVKCKSLRISAFKGGAQNDESEIRASSSKPGKNSVNLSYGPETREETLRKSPKAQNVPLSYTEPNNSIGGSPAIHNLFKSWLTMLRTQSPGQVGDGIVEEGPSEEISETQKEETKGRVVISKTVMNYFLGLDATIKIPLLMFIPWYLSVYVVYGAQVAKELTPLWVLGPFIVALYIKILRGIAALYIFTFKQTVKLIKNSPTYFRVAYAFVKEGRLLWQPLVDIITLDYKQFSRRKMNELGECIVERYLDFVESIWPYYCRTIRFLKRANFI